MAGKIFKSILILTAFFGGMTAAGWWWFGPTGTDRETITFTVPQKQEGFNYINILKEQGLIRNTAAFRWLAGGKNIKPGGYYLHKNMAAWEVINKLNGKPDLVWVTFSACLRKEQIGEILAEALGWKTEDLKKWGKTEEGQYYPDTYLIPAGEPAEETEKRLTGRFNEKLAPLSEKFLAANIKWTTGVKIASLIAREAAGSEDMKLISGIIWNRLNEGMRLQIDATMQYTYGKRSDGSWWGPVNTSEKNSNSPYNTYLYTGLPPTPICSPNISYIEAVLEPEETNCLYYLHDGQKQIHCAATYKEHLENIEKYL